MKVSCLQENLAKGLSIVGRAVATRSTLPVLSNILLSTDPGRKLSATHLEIGITCWIGGKVEKDGATTIPARTFVDWVGALPAERADMELDVRTQTLNLKCGRFENTSGALTTPSSHSSPPPPTPMPSALAHPLRVIH